MFFCETMPLLDPKLFFVVEGLGQNTLNSYDLLIAKPNDFAGGSWRSTR